MIGQTSQNKDAKVNDMSKGKAILVPMPMALHTRFKHRVGQDQRSMSDVTRGLIESYLAGEVNPGHSPMPRIPREPVEDSVSVIDQVAAMVHDAVDN